MAVSPEIVREVLREELKRVRDYGKSYRWGIIPDLERLTVIVTLYAHNDDPYIVKFLCDDYKEIPPAIDFIDPLTGEIGTKNAFPRGADSFFHTDGPCICAPFNRNAYKKIHPDWKYGDWLNSNANNFDWSNYSELVGMLSLIQSRLNSPEQYKGRMA